VVGLTMMVVPTASVAGGDVKLQDIIYESWSKPKLGATQPLRQIPAVR